VSSFTVLYEDVIGSPKRPQGPRISSLGLAEPLTKAVIAFLGGDFELTPPQTEAIERGVLVANRHFLVSAPTNSGKTLIALLRIFHRALLAGGRYIYVVPLKALAEEKLTELEVVAKLISNAGGREICIGISTGDYLISEDFPDSPPPDTAEVLVCTPERLEVLLRNPEASQWANSVDTYVLDEFHILGDGNRGARFETLVTRLLLNCPSSTLLALSATFGSVDLVGKWLGGSSGSALVVTSTYRYPRLHRQLVCDHDKDGYVLDVAAQVGREDDRSLIVFVYRKSDAEKLAKRIGEVIHAPALVAAFHSGLSLVRKRNLAGAFRDRRVKILICTTALAMGVNTPATDVIVRDTVFHGHRRLDMSDIQQMTGRAGRGTREGHAIVVFSDNEEWSGLASAMRDREVPPIEPQLISRARFSITRRRHEGNGTVGRLATTVLAYVAAQKSAALNGLVGFLSRTYSGTCSPVSASEVSVAVRALESDKLLYQIENSDATFAATRLGQTVSFTGLSADTGAMFGAFLRALIGLSEKQREKDPNAENLLRRLTDLDLLVLCLASFETRDLLLPKLRDEQLRELEEHLELLPPSEKPLVSLWRDSGSTDYPTRRLLATLRFTGETEARTLWRLLRTGAMLREHARGRELDDLMSIYGAYEGDIEGRLKPTVIWLLHSLAQICTGDRCYKLDFIALRAYTLMQDLAAGGSLGRLLAVDGIGVKSIEKLTSGGVRRFEDLATVQPEELLAMGLVKRQVSAIRRVVARHSR
jgi:replicative superfamily II helicase